MFSKFFAFGSKSDDKNVQPEPPPLPHSCSWEPVAFEATQLRVIVLRESNAQGRQALFDSLAWDRQNRKHSSSRKATPDPELKRTSSVGSQSENGSSTSRSHCRLKRLGDTEMLAEMMFGSVAIVSRGSTVKLHRLRDPPRLLITKVFSWQQKQGTSSVMSPVEPPVLGSSTSLPVNVGSPSYHTPSTQSLPSSPQDIPAPFSLRSTPFEPASESLTSASPGSMFFSPTGSFLTRQRHSLVVSLEFATARKSQDDLFSPVGGKRGKLAIGVIVTLPSGCTEEIANKQRLLLDFFFSHFPFVESHIEQLRESIESVLESSSSNSQRNIIEQFAEVVSFFKSVIVNLCQSLRLNSPIWLSLMKSTVPRNTTCKRLIDMLNHAVTHYNIPTNKQFLTSLLTAVLSYHLGWVSTVVPSQSNRDNFYLNKHASNSYTTLAQSHPYNPLWAQLADLYGAIGSPPHTTHTVIVGHKGSVVYQLLYIISYFIRCTHVIEFDSSLESYWHPDGPETETEIDSNGTPVEDASSVCENDFDSQLSALMTTPLMKSSDNGSYPTKLDKMIASASSPDIGALGREKKDIISPACSTQSLVTEVGTDMKLGLGEQSTNTKHSVFSLDSGLGTEENGVVIKRRSKEKGDDFKACSVSALSQSLKETDLVGMDFVQLVERFSELEDVELPRYRSEETDESEGDEASNSAPGSLSESLFGGFTAQYHPDFVLQGTAEELNDFMPRLSQDLQLQLNHPGIDEFVDEAVCIVADTEQWTCDIVSLTNQRPNARQQRREPCVNIRRAEKSALVQSLLDTLQEMHQHNMPDEFCLMQLEDKLQEIYYKSRVFSEHYRSDQYHEMSESKLASAAGVDTSDLPLLQSVAQTQPSFPRSSQLT